jgi:thioester reductase-like protein
MKTALITGANGFIGHYLVEEFVKDHRVICVVRPGTTNMVRLEEFVNAIEIIERDIGKCKVGIELERCLVQLKEIIERTKE